MKRGTGRACGSYLNGLPATFHRPHPRKEASKHVVRSARDFLRMAGFTPDFEEE